MHNGAALCPLRRGLAPARMKMPRAVIFWAIGGTALARRRRMQHGAARATRRARGAPLGGTRIMSRTIAFVGLGAMGRQMARRLVEAQNRVAGFDLVRQRAPRWRKTAAIRRRRQPTRRAAPTCSS